MRSTSRILATLAIVAVLGLTSRTFPIGWHLWDKSLGDLCYAAAALLIIRLAIPRFRPLASAILALGFCIAIECFKLTGLPSQWQANPILRIIFGSTFSWHNIACYFLAIAALLGLEHFFD